MTRHPLPPHVQAFFAERLVSQMDASGHALASCRDTFRLLLNFTSDRLGRMPTSSDASSTISNPAGATAPAPAMPG